MKISDFKKLEKGIVDRNFSDSYSNLNKVMFVLSILGNLASIFLAFFFIRKIFSGAIPEQPIFVAIVSIVILSGLEILKRDIFDKFSFQYLKLKEFNKDVAPLALISLLIISISFYSSISGAREFSSKSKEMDSKKIEIVSSYTDSLSKVYDGKIQAIESEITSNKSKIENKDKEQTLIESSPPLTSQNKNRVRDLKSEKIALKDDNTKLASDEASVKEELLNKIKEYNTNITEVTSEKKEDNSKNSTLFICISTLIELIILAGVWFNEYYKFRSYTDFRERIDKDPNYQKWELYNSILEVIYTPDTKINDKLPTNKLIADLCKLSDLSVAPKNIIDFCKTLSSLNIIKSSGSARYFTKTRDQSIDSLKTHFRIT